MAEIKMPFALRGQTGAQMAARLAAFDFAKTPHAMAVARAVERLAAIYDDFKDTPANEAVTQALAKMTGYLNRPPLDLTSTSDDQLPF